MAEKDSIQAQLDDAKATIEKLQAEVSQVPDQRKDDESQRTAMPPLAQAARQQVCGSRKTRRTGRLAGPPCLRVAGRVCITMS